MKNTNEKEVQLVQTVAEWWTKYIVESKYLNRYADFIHERLNTYIPAEIYKADKQSSCVIKIYAKDILNKILVPMSNFFEIDVANHSPFPKNEYVKIDMKNLTAVVVNENNVTTIFGEEMVVEP